ncbi:MAG: PEGA domain-containing protein [Rickettsiales bacterium]|nr:PEGA domain-containing protein [Rickettsiales bacterium]
MKLFKTLLVLSLIQFAASCAMMFNEKNVDVTISSNPSGADIFIEGINYGKTPKTINIEPKNYVVTVSKEGYGTSQIQLESWVAVRNKKGDGGRCIADALGTILVVPYYSFYWSGKCKDFKQSEYIINIPYTGRGNNNSMMGVGKNPSEMVPYYYNQNTQNRQ